MTRVLRRLACADEWFYFPLCRGLLIQNPDRRIIGAAADRISQRLVCNIDSLGVLDRLFGTCDAYVDPFGECFRNLLRCRCRREAQTVVMGKARLDRTDHGFAPDAGSFT